MSFNLQISVHFDIDSFAPCFLNAHPLYLFLDYNFIYIFIKILNYYKKLVEQNILVTNNFVIVNDLILMIDSST